MQDILLDFAQARRLVRRHRGFVAFAVATLAIGVGASTLVFSLVHGALLRSLPFENPDTLVWMYNARTERDRAPFSILDLEDYRRANTTLADFAAFTNWAANLTGLGPPERLEGTRVAGNFFRVLGARPLMGRTLDPGDEEGDARVAVVTHGFWQRQLGGEPDVTGRPISLNGAAYTIVGVMPAGFMFPFREAEIAVPLALRSDPRRADRGANFLRVVARLSPGVTRARAKADLDTIAKRLQHLYPDEDSRKTGVNLYPLHAEIVRDYRRILWTLFAAVGLFLAIACGNLANLMFVRSIARAPEFVLRASLGASRLRIVRQLTIEGMAIAVMGGIAGLALAGLGLSLWRALGPANFPRRDEIGLDAGVVAFAMGVSLLVSLVCAVGPARASGRAGKIAVAVRSVTGSQRDRRLRRAFVAVQIAGAMILLVVMGLAARAFAALERVHAGFTPAHALSMQLSLPPRAYGDVSSIVRFHDALRMRLDSIAGIRAVGAVSLRPLSGLLSTMDVAFPGRPAPAPDEVPQAHFRVASAGYFSAAGIPVMAGREFEHADGAGRQPVAIVSETFAERHWPGEPAIGKSVQVVQSTPSAPMEVVGVVRDVKQFGLDGPATADLYVPLAQMPRSQAPFVAARMYWVLRTDGDPSVFAGPVRDVVRSVDPNVAASSIQTLEDVLDASLVGWRINVRLLQVFGQLAIGLCAIGVYAVASFSAAARRRELAIRSACGATRRELTAMMLRDELTPIGLGLAAGTAAAAALAPQLGALLFRTSPFDVWSYGVAVAGLLAVAVLATFVPVSRASLSNPGDLLRGWGQISIF